MRVVRTEDPVIAILLADVHLSLKAPAARADEPDWLAAMERPLTEVRALAEEHKSAIVLCAGDVFDRWNSPPELINWAIERLPHLYAVPGNHDLPNHRPELAHRSAFGTLARAGKLTLVSDDPIFPRPGLCLYGRPFGGPVPVVDRNYKGINVLLTHEYLWMPGAGHVGAPEEGEVTRAGKHFSEFDAVVAGDNHQAFNCTFVTRIWNCGTLMRRKASEFGYRPRVGLLRASGSVEPHYLDTSKDVISSGVTPEQERADEDAEVASFVGGLAALEATSLDFRDAIISAMRDGKVRQEVKDLILEAMEGKK